MRAASASIFTVPHALFYPLCEYNVVARQIGKRDVFHEDAPGIAVKADKNALGRIAGSGHKAGEIVNRVLGRHPPHTNYVAAVNVKIGTMIRTEIETQNDCGSNTCKRSELVLFFCNEIPWSIYNANCILAYQLAVCNLTLLVIKVRGGVQCNLFSCLRASLVERLCWLRCDAHLAQTDIGARASKSRVSAVWHFPITLT